MCDPHRPHEEGAGMSLLDKAKETAKKGAEKAKGAVEAGQEKIQENKIKGKIGDLKQELGGVVYAQRTGSANGGSDAEIARLVAEITDAEGELAKLAED